MWLLALQGKYRGKKKTRKEDATVDLIAILMAKPNMKPCTDVIVSSNYFFFLRCFWTCFYVPSKQSLNRHRRVTAYEDGARMLR